MEKIALQGTTWVLVIAKIGSSSLGKIVVNGKGMSAIFFDLDKAKSGGSREKGPQINCKTHSHCYSGYSRGKVSLLKAIRNWCFRLPHPIFTPVEINLLPF